MAIQVWMMFLLPSHFSARMSNRRFWRTLATEITRENTQMGSISITKYTSNKQYWRPAHTRYRNKTRENTYMGIININPKYNNNKQQWHLVHAQY